MNEGLTLDQAKNLQQGQTIFHMTRRNADGKTPMMAKVTSIKTWKSKRFRDRVEVKVKRGLYEYATFTEAEIHMITDDMDNCI